MQLSELSEYASRRGWIIIMSEYHHQLTEMFTSLIRTFA